MAKTPRQRIVKRLDDLLREIVRLRDNDTCQKCGKTVYGSNSQPSHVIAKGRCLLLRWDLLNVKLLCNSCHRWWHLNPINAASWFADRFPSRYDYVKQYEYKLSRMRMSDFQQIESLLKAKLQDLKGDAK